MYSKLINGNAVFSQLASDWDALAQQGVTDTPFQTLAYQQAWWTHLQPSDGNLHTIAVYDDDQALIGIACFYIIEGVLYFNGCIEETDYLDVIASAENIEAVWTAVFDCLCSPGFPNWTGLDLCNIPAASPSRTILPREAEKRGFRFNEEIIEVCPIIPLANSFEEYLSSINSKQRREIRRKLRRANGAEVQLVMVQPEDDVTIQVESFLNLLQKSTFEKREWLNDGRRQVFHDVAKATLANGTLQLMFLEVDGRKAAALFNFSYKGRTWVYNSGLDPDAFGNLSLGVVITAKAIEKGIEVGNTTFDFLRGNEIYKYRFGAKDTQIFKQQINR
ncbi:MAG: GNAT family N-acetyltransferase [Chloroflexi bacterium]|nr:GNAT family N-acetyltransferase [Chloroflexota bacterium]